MSLSILGDHVADSGAESGTFQVIFSHFWAEPWSVHTTRAGRSGSGFSTLWLVVCADSASRAEPWGAMLGGPRGFASLLQSGQMPTPCPGEAAKGSGLGSSLLEDLWWFSS